MSSTTMRSLRQIRVTVRATDPSALALRDRGGEGLEGVPGHAQVLLDRGVGQGLDQVRLACPGRAGDHEVLGAADPFQGGQGVLGGLGDGGFLRPPGGEGLPGGEPGGLAAHPPGGGVAAGDFLGEQDAEHLGGLPPLGAGGGEHVGGGFAQVGQPHPADQRVQLGRQRRGGGAGHRVAPGRGREIEVVDGQADGAAQRGRAAADPGGLGHLGHGRLQLRAAVLPGPAQQLRAGGQGQADHRDVLRSQNRVLPGLAVLTGLPPARRAGPSRRCRAGPSAPHRRSRPRRSRPRRPGGR